MPLYFRAVVEECLEVDEEEDLAKETVVQAGLCIRSILFILDLGPVKKKFQNRFRILPVN